MSLNQCLLRWSRKRIQAEPSLLIPKVKGYIRSIVLFHVLHWVFPFTRSALRCSCCRTRPLQSWQSSDGCGQSSELPAPHALLDLRCLIGDGHSAATLDCGNCLRWEPVSEIGGLRQCREHTKIANRTLTIGEGIISGEDEVDWQRSGCSSTKLLLVYRRCTKQRVTRQNFSRK